MKIEIKLTYICLLFFLTHGDYAKPKKHKSSFNIIHNIDSEEEQEILHNQMTIAIPNFEIQEDYNYSSTGAEREENTSIDNLSDLVENENYDNVEEIFFDNQTESQDSDK